MNLSLNSATKRPFFRYRFDHGFNQGKGGISAISICSEGR